MRYLQWAFWVSGLYLQFLVLAALMSGPYREFPVLFLYIVCLLVTTVSDIVLYTIRHPAYANAYWASEVIRQSALFSVVISMVLSAIPEARSRRATLYVVFAAALLFWAGSMAVHYQPAVNRWMTGVIRDLSFCSAVLNLGLWFVLISRPNRNMRQLLIAGGLGIQMTGDAIGQSIRQMQLSAATFHAGNILIVLTHLLCLYIWTRALRSS
jgi:hypothetical protein